MTALDRLRAWAEGRGLEVRTMEGTPAAGGSWIAVYRSPPTAMSQLLALDGFGRSVEAAAQRLIDRLALLGEEVP